MSPADERRRLVMAAQRSEPYPSGEWFAHEHHSSLYVAAPPKRRGWSFVAVSAGLVVAALGTCWALASSGSIAQWTQGVPDRPGTTEVTAAKAETPAEVAAPANVVPTTAQPAVVPPAPVVQAAIAPPTAVVPPVIAPPTVAPQEVPVESLPAAARGPHHEPAGQTTIHVVETPDPETNE